MLCPRLLKGHGDMTDSDWTSLCMSLCASEAQGEHYNANVLEMLLFQDFLHRHGLWKLAVGLSITMRLTYQNPTQWFLIWVFPKIMVPPNHPMFNRVFGFSIIFTIHFGGFIYNHPYFWKHPIYSNDSHPPNFTHHWVALADSWRTELPMPRASPAKTPRPRPTSTTTWMPKPTNKSDQIWPKKCPKKHIKQIKYH